MYRLLDTLGGPVLAWELKRAARGYARKLLVLGYPAWLVVLAIAVMSATRLVHDLPEDPVDYYFADLRARDEQLTQFLNSFLTVLLQSQLILVLVMTPAIVASCLGQEKERGTLFALFGTELTSRQIVLGKLLGRLSLLAPVLFTAVPVLVFTVTLSGREFGILILALGQQLILAFTLGAICLLIGIWIRRTADAVIVAYVALGLGYMVIRGLASRVPGASCLDPVASLDKLLSGGTRLAFVSHLALWALLGGAFLRVDWELLRKVCLEQREKRPSRRLWAFRPAVGNDAIRWRECYVIGLAPIPILRMVPRWLGLVGVFTFSATLAGLIAEDASPGFLATLWNRNIVGAFADLRRESDAIAESVWLMGLVFVLLSDMLLLVRCVTSVAEEKRRNTWDDLLLTAQSFREITNGKMWGILQATVPVIIAFALPVCLLAALGGWKAMLFAAMWIILPCLAVFGAAHSGIDMMHVPKDMDETREGGAFWYENRRRQRKMRSGKGIGVD
jgi:hypothetical protein